MKIPDIAESIAIKLFTKEFGTDLLVRHNKFMEEVGELNQAFHEYRLEPTPERLEHLLDEYSDVQGTFTHLASLMPLYQREMLHNCIDKVKGRKIDPNYKRFSNFPVQEATKIVHDTIFPSSNHNGINTMEAFIPGDHELSQNT